MALASTRLPLLVAPLAYDKNNEQQTREVLDTRLSDLERLKARYNPQIKASSYTVATVPSAAESGAGAIIYVSNESGGAVLAFSDATNWRRVTDRAIIS